MTIRVLASRGMLGEAAGRRQRPGAPSIPGAAHGLEWRRRRDSFVGLIDGAEHFLIDPTADGDWVLWAVDPKTRFQTRKLGRYATAADAKDAARRGQVSAEPRHTSPVRETGAAIHLGAHIHWKGDFSNPPKSGSVERIGADGYTTVAWDDGTRTRVPTALFSTPRWTVGEPRRRPVREAPRRDQTPIAEASVKHAPYAKRVVSEAARKSTLTVTLPDGQVAARTTARPYTHVVVGLFSNGWRSLTWTANPADALRAAKRFWAQVRSFGRHEAPSELQLRPVDRM